MKLFHVQDDSRPMWVMAETWRAAFNGWCKQIAAENNIDQAEVEDPQGIQFIAENRDSVGAMPEILIVQEEK